MKTFIEKHKKEDGRIQYLYPYKAEKMKPPPYADGVEMLEVPEPPSKYHVYNGKEWVEDAEAIALKESKEAKEALKEIDADSVRAIREYIYAVENGDDVLKQEALTYLEQEELEAKAEREKLK